MNGSSSGTNTKPGSNNGTMPHGHHMMMHMTFFWGKNTEILFDGWPGYDHLGMYLFALAVVFFLCLFVEWLSNSSVLTEVSKHQTDMVVGLLQTMLYALRTGVAYMVMLALMSFNGGVFLVAIVGHAVGFFLFGSRAFNKQTPVSEDGNKGKDLTPLNCC